MEELVRFQWAPTLGGECYVDLAAELFPHLLGFNGHPPLGVNATRTGDAPDRVRCAVSMGTHPWG